MTENDAFGATQRHNEFLKLPPAHYADSHVTLYAGDCINIMRQLPDASISAVVTDPPYGLEFMGKEWDAPWKAGADVHAEARIRRADEVTPTGQAHSTSAGPYLAVGVNKYQAGVPFQAWCEEWAAECLRILKPGGHLLAFGGTRTWHRLACAIEDAGFEIRDSIAWMYGSGFPKSLDVSKAIDKAAGVEREVVDTIPDRWAGKGNVLQRSTQDEAESVNITVPATDDARKWAGWGTALKPAHEPIVVARKPLTGTVAANVLTHGTGALNIDACRIGTGGQLKWEQPRDMGYHGGSDSGTVAATDNPAGRWPANVTLDQHTAAQLDRQSGQLSVNGPATWRSGNDGTRDGFMGAIDGRGAGDVRSGFGDSGGASRFFYTAKASSDERPREDGIAHPTVKPLSLMRWLIRLVTPPGGVVLDPFAGSGTTAEACIIENHQCVTIEREDDYLPLIVQRLTKPIQPDMFSGIE